MMNANRSEADISIRRLTPADAPAYRALRLRGLAEHPDAFTSSHDEEAAKPLSQSAHRLSPDSGDVLYGAFVDGALVGVVGWSRDARAKNRHRIKVVGMFVAPEHTRRGVGAALLAHLVDAARREPGVEQLVLTVTDSNAAARSLYERAGFHSFGVEPRAIRVGDTYYDKNHMVRFLPPA